MHGATIKIIRGAA